MLRRSRESGNPYAVRYRLGAVAVAFFNNGRRRLRVPAFAGTTQ